MKRGDEEAVLDKDKLEDFCMKDSSGEICFSNLKEHSKNINVNDNKMPTEALYIREATAKGYQVLNILQKFYINSGDSLRI